MADILEEFLKNEKDTQKGTIVISGTHEEGQLGKLSESIEGRRGREKQQATNDFV